MRTLTNNELKYLSAGYVTHKFTKKEDAFIAGFAFGVVASYMAFRNGILLSVLMGIGIGTFFSAAVKQE